MMNLFVFTDLDRLCLKSLVLLLSVSPIVGGGVASFAYVIVARGTYLIGIVVCESNRVNEFFCRTLPLCYATSFELVLMKPHNPHG